MQPINTGNRNSEATRRPDDEGHDASVITRGARSQSLAVGGSMFEARSLHKQYLGIPALDHVSFVARPGEVTGYLGANGSGKSTTMKLATGLIAPTSGEILLGGHPIWENPMAYRQRLGYVPEE